MQPNPVDYGKVEALAALASTPPEEKPERVAPHVRRFYRHMMGLLGSRGIAEDTQVAKSMKVLGMKEQFSATRAKPFGRRDRQAAVKKLVDEGKIAQPKTRVTRHVPAVVDPRAVDHMLSQLPDDAKATPEALTATIGRMFGYHDPDSQTRATARAHRFMANRPGARLPAHLRRSLVMDTSVMVALVALFPDRARSGAAEVTEALRAQFA